MKARRKAKTGGLGTRIVELKTGLLSVARLARSLDQQFIAVGNFELLLHSQGVPVARKRLI